MGNFTNWIKKQATDFGNAVNQVEYHPMKISNHNDMIEILTKKGYWVIDPNDQKQLQWLANFLATHGYYPNNEK